MRDEAGKRPDVINICAAVPLSVHNGCKAIENEARANLALKIVRSASNCCHVNLAH